MLPGGCARCEVSLPLLGRKRGRYALRCDVLVGGPLTFSVQALLLVHGLIGPIQQCMDLVGIIGVHGASDACVERELVSREIERPIEVARSSLDLCEEVCSI